MRIITVIEDTCGREDCRYEHGLCIYAETDRHRLLVDTGATGAILHNARVLGIDLCQVDCVVLSHGHYDHAGGILPFTGINPHARIYMKKTAADGYYHGDRYIGIDQRIPYDKKR
ncbi:MAG: MBL fold metallo-hydrolase [Lachnospiraceae bacterium]|nr:MBL fold metallo-hydrolase [Lachnospiraceae bacterium]